MKILLLSVVLSFTLYSLSLGQSEWESGYETTIRWQSPPIHILHSQPNVIPRSLEYQVDFQTAFKQVPDVWFGIMTLDSQLGGTLDFKLEITETTLTYFKYKVTINSQKQFYTIFFNWLAIFDANVESVYLDFATPNLEASGRKASKIYKQSQTITFKKTYSRPPNITPYLAGWAQTGDSTTKNIELLTFASSVTKKKCLVTAQNTVNSKVSQVRILVIVTPSEQSYISVLGEVREDDSTNSWTEGSSQRMTAYSENIGTKYAYTDVIRLIGLVTVAARQSSNFRLLINNPTLSGRTFSINAGTWSDSQIESIEVMGLFLTPSKVEEPDIISCAKIYKKCNQQGTSLEICENNPVNSFKSAGFTNDAVIRSVEVPNGGVLTLYLDENLTGSSQQFSASDSCISYEQDEEIGDDEAYAEDS